MQQKEVTIFDLIKSLWSYKWLFIIITVIIIGISAVVAFSIANEYTAKLVLKENKSTNQTGLNISGQLGGLASLAGVDLGGEQSIETEVALEILQSWGFIDRFILKYQIESELIDVIGWDQENNKLVYSDERLSLKTAKTDNDKRLKSWTRYQVFLERLEIEKNQQTGLYEIGFTHYSPYLAKKWLKLLVDELNSTMREKSLDEVNRNIKYLETEITNTNIAELRVALSNLVEEQHKSKMMASVSEEFIFKPVNELKVPHQKSKPKRVLILFLGSLLGGLVSLVIISLCYIYNHYKKVESDANKKI